MAHFHADTATWVTQAVETAGIVGDSLSLAFDPTGKIAVSYRGADGSLKFALDPESLAVATPEPGTLLLLGSGLAALAGYRCRRGDEGKVCD